MGLTELEQRLVDTIARSHHRLLDDLALHVSIPTGLDHRPGLDHTREIFTSRLKALNAQVTLVPAGPKPAWLYGGETALQGPPSVMCTRTHGRAGPRILLSGHLDTVHDPSPAAPFRNLVIDHARQTATGPGCVDMKGGLVIAVAALEALEELGIPVAWSFIFNSDEETGSYWSEPALRHAARDHDIGLVFEPALPDGSLVISRPGSGQFMVEARGRSAHVGRDFASGISAVTALARAIVRMSEFADPAMGRILNIGPMHGGIATNVVPDHARAWGNVRYKDEPTARLLEGMVLSCRQDHVLPSVHIETSFNRPAKPATEGVMKLAHAARAAAEDLGQAMPFGSTGGVCDGNILQDAGLPVIDTLGVRGGGLHTPDEWIDLRSLVERTQLTALLMHRLSAS
ncbi:MAG TPA: M20/M25/M40 family metallo-hydrolase [Phycisphaerales bacterium]|nr:M20/M25/M40 family metallo-hydrolase [Phycisphaerales bacterium]